MPDPLDHFLGRIEQAGRAASGWKSERGKRTMPDGIYDTHSFGFQPWNSIIKHDYRGG